MNRLFVGLEIPESIKQHLVLLCHGVPGARWLRDDQLHVTVRFIGEVDPPKAADIDAALGAVRAPRFSVRLKGVDIFGESRKPRALWAGIEPEEDVQHLRDKVESALVRNGVTPEKRKFKPHLTLARFKERPRRLPQFLTANNDFSTDYFPVEDFILFESHLSQTGAQYEVKARYPLLDKAG